MRAQADGRRGSGRTRPDYGECARPCQPPGSRFPRRHEMEHYIRKIVHGGINAKPDIRVRVTGPATAMVDGDDGPGHAVMDRADGPGDESGDGAVLGARGRHRLRDEQQPLRGVVLFRQNGGITRADRHRDDEHGQDGRPIRREERVFRHKPDGVRVFGGGARPCRRRYGDECCGLRESSGSSARRGIDPLRIGAWTARAARLPTLGCSLRCFLSAGRKDTDSAWQWIFSRAF